MTEDTVLEIVRLELAKSYERLANRLNTGTPNLVPPIAQERVRHALISEAIALAEAVEHD